MDEEACFVAFGFTDDASDGTDNDLANRGTSLKLPSTLFVYDIVLQLYIRQIKHTCGMAGQKVARHSLFPK